jgi:predicted GH43/DUF377 family glycosyl hydrolase
MYYAGYQIVNKVRFLVLCGLSISNDGGETFTRYQKNPILERTNNELLFRVIHSISYENEKWRIWYGGGSYFKDGKLKSLPVYDIRYMESKDGINFPLLGKIVLSNSEDEYRVGRPYVIKVNKKYIMFFGASKENDPYRLRYATSDNGIIWNRKKQFGLKYKSNEFDSEMSAYPGVIQINGKFFMYYNGNNYGKEGIGLAELIEIEND